MFGLRAVLLFLALGYFAASVAAHVLQIRALAYAKGVDQCYLIEALLNTVHGRFFEHTHAVTNLAGFGKMDHFFAIMLLFLPLAWVLQHPIVLYVVGAASLAGAGIGVYLVARDCLGDARLALLAALAFWTMPELCFFNLSGSWPETWAMPWLALMFHFYDRRRALPFALCAVLLMACMEHYLVFVALFALAEALTRRERRWVALPAGLAAGWAMLLVVLASTLWTGRFQTHPVSWSAGSVLAYVGSLFLSSERSPLLYLMLLAPPTALFALPSSVVMVAWGMTVEMSPSGEGAFRYASYLILPMAIGGLYGLRRVATAAERWWGWRPRTVVGVGLLVAVAAHMVTLTRLTPAWRMRLVPGPAAEATWRIASNLPLDARLAVDREVPYVFLGRADACVVLAPKGKGLAVVEYLFGRTTVSRGEHWLPDARFDRIGRHTPIAFVLENRGGVLVPARALAVDSTAGKVRLDLVRCQEVDGDGAADVVVGQPGGRQLAFLARGRSAFDFELRPTHAPAAAAGDDTGGSEPTVRIANDHSTITVSGPGVGGSPVELRFGGYVEEVLVDDLDGDGSAEVVVLDSEEYQVWVIEPTSSGVWSRRGPYPAPPIPRSMSAGDLDGDGDDDLVVTKSWTLPDPPALDRFLGHERIDHLLLYTAGSRPDVLEYFSGNPRWLVERLDGLLYCRRQAAPG